jgi:hypothetical protein
MSWKFWEKSATGKLPGPKKMLYPVGRELVLKGADPDWVWNLKCVERPKEGKENWYDIRVFDESSAGKKSISVQDYTSLDQAPDLILFEGRYNKKSLKAEVVKTQPNEAMK